MAGARPVLQLTDTTPFIPAPSKSHILDNPSQHTRLGAFPRSVPYSSALLQAPHVGGAYFPWCENDDGLIFLPNFTPISRLIQVLALYGIDLLQSLFNTPPIACIQIKLPTHRLLTEKERLEFGMEKERENERHYLIRLNADAYDFNNNHIIAAERWDDDQPLSVSLEYRWNGVVEVDVMYFMDWEGIVNIVRSREECLGLKGEMI